MPGGGEEVQAASSWDGGGGQWLVWGSGERREVQGENIPWRCVFETPFWRLLASLAVQVKIWVLLSHGGCTDNENSGGGFVGWAQVRVA